MVELPYDLNIHGFAFGRKFEHINFDEILFNLDQRYVRPEDVVFSTMYSEQDDCHWIIAASQYLNDTEINDILEVIINNNIQDEYILIDELPEW